MLNSLDPTKQRIFGLMKMQEIINVNLYRIDVFWDLVIAHFLCIANSKNGNLRKMAVETLIFFISSAFAFFFSEGKKNLMNEKSAENTKDNTKESCAKNFAKNTSENIAKSCENEKSAENLAKIESCGKTCEAQNFCETSSPEENIKKKTILKEKWMQDNWQKTLLQPWLDVMRCKFNELKESIVNSLLRLLQDNGHEITNSGWSIILSILKEVSEENNSNYTNTGEFSQIFDFFRFLSFFGFLR